MNIGLSDDDFFNMFRQISEDLERMMREMSSIEPGKPRKVVKGFSIKIGPDGKIKMEEFGNTRHIKGPDSIAIREPLVDVIEKDRTISVLAELPGVSKKDIEVRLSKDGKYLTIEVPGKFYKKVELPAKVKRSHRKATYKNGILEVELQKLKSNKRKDDDIIEIE
ncbi:Hsp20/alpha crystallin family protein [Candidatus Micrarchaeota archaeon]|nr:MAG: Hsp20/alpha crystallin family protein [Candidatus Micrarchaeota archaeon]